MKITAIMPYPVWVGTRNQMLVKVETDEGIFGWGESGLSGREKAVAGRDRALPRVPDRARPDADRRAVAGDVPQPVFRGRARAARPPSRPSTSRSTTSRARRWACRSTSCSAASSATGSRPSPPSAAATPEEMLDPAQALKARGWDCIRFFPLGEAGGGIFEPRESIAADRAADGRGARGAGPRASVLGIDYHHRLSVAETASFCQKLPPGTLDFLEEPIRDETPEAYEALRRMTDVPFAIGEEFASRSGSSCPTSSAASTSSTASTSAMSAASPRR